MSQEITPGECVKSLSRSYTVTADGGSITFHPCGVTSHNPNDVMYAYCARCHCFVGEDEFRRLVPRQQRAEK